jgi:hypothetical protein
LGEAQWEAGDWTDSSGTVSGSSSISTTIGSWLDSQTNWTGFVFIGDRLLVKNLLFFVTSVSATSTLGLRSDNLETPGPDWPTGVGSGLIFGGFEPVWSVCD